MSTDDTGWPTNTEPRSEAYLAGFQYAILRTSHRLAHPRRTAVHDCIAAVADRAGRALEPVWGWAAGAVWGALMRLAIRVEGRPIARKGRAR
jgi:hypothetical protein